MNKLTNVLFTIYLLALVWILLFKLGVQFSYMANRSVNFIPFGAPAYVSETMMNIVIFVPLGIYAGVLFKRWTFGIKLLFFLVISLMLEGLQYIFRIGAFDITDIMTNTSGGIIGLMIFGVIEKIFTNRVKAQKFINIMAAIGTVFMIAFLVLLKLNLLPVRYQ